ncbi:hypothetical protein [Endozoicomonas ascidiicola]|uniref:hypothetical protein n=1 Tax=Endozoicomonas ascidiicola TaxID=1698521 RepID=UPI00082AF732|nr:hypothetical protein [Endozoicomonas ascidiicola]
MTPVKSPVVPTNLDSLPLNDKSLESQETYVKVAKHNSREVRLTANSARNEEVKRKLTSKLPEVVVAKDRVIESEEKYIKRKAEAAKKALETKTFFQTVKEVAKKLTDRLVAVLKVVYKKIGLEFCVNKVRDLVAPKVDLYLARRAAANSEREAKLLEPLKAKLEARGLAAPIMAKLSSYPCAGKNAYDVSEANIKLLEKAEKRDPKALAAIADIEEKRAKIEEDKRKVFYEHNSDNALIAKIKSELGETEDAKSAIAYIEKGIALEEKHARDNVYAAIDIAKAAAVKHQAGGLAYEIIENPASAKMLAARAALDEIRAARHAADDERRAARHAAENLKYFVNLPGAPGADCVDEIKKDVETEKLMNRVLSEIVKRGETSNQSAPSVSVAQPVVQEDKQLVELQQLIVELQQLAEEVEQLVGESRSVASDASSINLIDLS